MSVATVVLRHQAPAMLEPTVYWATPVKTVVQLGTTLALVVSHASLQPQRQGREEWGSA